MEMSNLQQTIILLIVLVVAVVGKADSVATAACILLLLRLLHLDKYIYPTIEKEGVFWGLVILTAAILIPLANGKASFVSIKSVFTSWVGIVALGLSFLTTYLSGLGLNYLTVGGHSDVMPAMIIGSVGAAAFLGGVPVGPLITSGMLVLILKVFHKS